jgi:hypothetical protein
MINITPLLTLDCGDLIIVLLQTLACEVSRDDFKQVLRKLLLTDTGWW